MSTTAFFAPHFAATVATMSSTVAPRYNISRNPVSFALDIFPENLRDIHHINERIVFVLSLVANTALITLLATEQNKVLQAYSNVLIQNCVVDVVQTIVLFSGEFQMEFVDGRMITMVNSVFRELPMPFHYFCNFSWVLVCCAAVCALPIVFYFRYQLIVHGRLLTRLELFQLLCIPITVAVMEGLALMIAMHSGDALREEMCPRLLYHPIWHRPGTDISTCMFSDGDNPFLIFYFYFAIFLDLGSYAIMGYCTMTVLRAMRESKVKVSEKTRKMQRQMNLMLFVQMVVPLFSGILPVVVMMGVPFFRISMPGVGVMVTLAFSWMPLMNPFTTMFLVTNFRRKVIRWVLYVPRVFMPTRKRVTNIDSTHHDEEITDEHMVI